MYKVRLFFIISILLHVLVLILITFSFVQKRIINLPHQNKGTKVTFIQNNKQQNSQSQQMTKISSAIKNTNLQKQKYKPSNIIAEQSTIKNNKFKPNNHSKVEIKKQKAISTFTTQTSVTTKNKKPNIDNIQRIENPHSSKKKALTKKNIKPQKNNTTKKQPVKNAKEKVPSDTKPKIKTQKVDKPTVKQTTTEKKLPVKKQTHTKTKTKSPVKKQIAKKSHDAKLKDNTKENIRKNDFTSILADVNETIEKKSDNKSDEFEDEYEYQSSNMLDTVASEKDMIKEQIESSWKSPVILDINIQSVKIHLFIEINSDGSLKNLKIQKIDCPYGKKDLCKVLADSTINAVYSAAPFKGLAKQNHHLWKKFDLIFDPSFMVNS